MFSVSKMGSITRHANKCFVLFLVDIKLGYYIIRIPCVYVWCWKGRGADGEEGHWEDRCNSDFVIWRPD